MSFNIFCLLTHFFLDKTCFSDFFNSGSLNYSCKVDYKKKETQEICNSVYFFQFIACFRG